MLKYEGVIVPSIRKIAAEGDCVDRLMQRLYCDLFLCPNGSSCEDCIYGVDNLAQFKRASVAGVLPEIEVAD
jgi:hypothetical protein